MLTRNSLAAFCSGAVAYLVPLQAACNRYSINSSLREIHFLAQLAHESGGFRFTRELWGPTPQQLRYERDFSAPWPSSVEESKLPACKVNRLAYGLGNSEKGDGRKFLGRGLIQITGRANYARLSMALFRDLRLLDKPEILQLPEHAAMSAAWFWDSNKLNTWADKDDLKAVSGIVNTGSPKGIAHGLDDGDRRDLDTRADWLDQARKVIA